MNIESYYSQMKQNIQDVIEETAETEEISEVEITDDVAEEEIAVVEIEDVVEETAENETLVNEQNKQNTERNPQFEGRIPSGMQSGFPDSMQNNNQQTRETEPMTFWGFVKTDELDQALRAWSK